MHASQYTGPSKIKVARVSATDADASIMLTRRERAMLLTEASRGPTGGDDLNAAAIGIVRNALGAYLTVTRPEPPHEFALPGGHVDATDADPLAAMVRELAEETGVKVTKAHEVQSLKSPVDGRTVHVFVVDEYEGAGDREPPIEEGTRVSWLTADQLLTQAYLYKTSAEQLIDAKVLCDLGVGDVHTPAAVGDDSKGKRTMAVISTKKRNALPDSSFAWPEKRKFPVSDAAHTRAAASRLAQAVKQGRVSKEQAAKIHSRIAAAGKKFGVEIAADDSDTGSSNRIHIRADIAHGGSLHVTHHAMTDNAEIATFKDGSFRMRDIRAIKQGAEVDPTEAGVSLKGPSVWKDGTPKRLVWTQLAEVGSWKGHSAGPFEMTPKTFDEVVANFNARGLPIACDFEHASEADATEGDIPIKGAPAQGWAHKLESRGIGGLWGLVEWLDYARECIKAGSYAYLSPAIRFGSKDPVTGQPVGARCTSFALTNSPFLIGLPQLVAARDNGGGVAASLADKSKLSSPVHGPHKYMPAVRQALKMDALSSPQECADKLDKVRELCMALGPTGVSMGENLSDYTAPLSDMVQASPGMEWDEVFDIVEDLIAHAIDQHDAEMHPNGAAMADATEETTMADKDKTLEQVTALLTDKETKVSELSLQLKDFGIKLNEATTALSESSVKLKDAETTIGTLNSTIALKDTEIAGKDAELKTLREDKAKRDEADLVAHVENAFLTYKDAKKLTDTDKEHMMIVARNNPAVFAKNYPPVPADQRHLLRQAVREEPARGADPNAGVTPSYADQMTELQRSGMSFSEAQLTLSRRG